MAALALTALLPSAGRIVTPPKRHPAAAAAEPTWERETPPANAANLLRNTSLEWCATPGVPDYWRPGEAWSDFRQANFGVEWEYSERAGKFHRSGVILRNTKGSNRAALDYPYMVVSDKSKPCVFSVWLKASKPGYAVRLAIYGGFDRTANSEELAVDGNSCIRSIKVGTEWKRYAVVSPPFRPGTTVRNRVAIIADSTGELCIDGLQLESGNEPTAYGPRPGDGPSVVEASDREMLACRAIGKVRVDGVLRETDWERSERTDPFVRLGDGEKPGAETRARVLFDEERLYVGFLCEESGEPRDLADGVIASDHVEVFVSASGDGGGYRHYAVDSKGRVHASIGRETAIETAATGGAAREAGRWTAEIAIPWGEIGLPLRAPESLRVNFARFRLDAREWASWSRARDTLHEPRTLGELTGLDPRTLGRFGSAIPRLAALAGAEGAEIDALLEVSGEVRGEPGVRVQLGEEERPGRLESLGRGAYRLRAGPFPVEAQTRRTALVLIDEAKSERRLGIHRRIDVRVPPRVEVFFERSYYTREKTARLLAVIHDPSLTSLSARGESGGWEQSDVAPGAGAVAVFEVPLRGREEGAEVFTVSGGGVELGKGKLVRRAARANEVKLDYLRGCLVVDDKPFVPVAPGWLAHENLRDVSDGSWSAVMHKRWHEPTGVLYATGEVSQEALDSLRDFLDRSWRGGMRVLFHLPIKLDDNGCAKDEEAIGKLIEAFRDHPALLAWHTVDEPGPRATPEKLLRIANMVRDLDPWHPVWINEATFWQKATQYCRTDQPACDLFSVDHYPVGAPGEGVTSIATWMERLEEIGRWRKPMLMWLQAFGAIEWWSREPTPEEERAMTWLSLIHGGRGVMYFVYRPRSPALWEECRRLGAELTTQVAPVLGRSIRSDPIDLGTPSIHAVLLEGESGERWLMTVNAGTRRVEADVSPLLLGGTGALEATALVPQGLEVTPGDGGRLRFALAGGEGALLELRTAATE